MIAKLQRIWRELWTPSALEGDTASQRSYRRCTGAISHCVLGAGAMAALALAGVPAALAGFLLMWAYTFKEVLDYCEAKDAVDCLVDWTVTATGVVLFTSPLLPLVALAIGAVIFFAYI